MSRDAQSVMKKLLECAEEINGQDEQSCRIVIIVEDSEKTLKGGNVPNAAMSASMMCWHLYQMSIKQLENEQGIGVTNDKTH